MGDTFISGAGAVVESALPAIYGAGDSMLSYGPVGVELWFDRVVDELGWAEHLNTSVQGHTLVQILDDIAPILLRAKAGRSQNCCIVMGGGNDAVAGASAATIQTRWIAVVNALKAVGLRVIASTVPEGNDLFVGGILTVIQAYNTWLRANALNYCHALMDPGTADSRFNDKDSDLFFDDRHFSDAGMELMKGIGLAKVRELPRSVTLPLLGDLATYNRARLDYLSVGVIPGGGVNTGGGVQMRAADNSTQGVLAPLNGTDAIVLGTVTNGGQTWIVGSANGGALVARFGPTSQMACSRVYLNSDFSGPFISTAAGTPEGAVAAPVGSLFLRSDGSTSTTLYVKTSGSGNTGWTAK